MTSIKRMCVFCGSKHGARPSYTEGARQLAQTLVQHQIGLVYGGLCSITVRVQFFKQLHIVYLLMQPVQCPMLICV